MIVKKAGGKIYGAILTSAEKKAMEMEISRQVAEFDRQNMLAIDAVILWELHEQFGFGADRLRRFFDGFGRRFNELIDHYEMGSEDGPYICLQKLKDLGVDLEEWMRETDEEGVIEL